MNGYSYSKVLEMSANYFNGDEFAAKVFADKYALQTPDGEFLEQTPEAMHHRLAKEFARIELKYPNPISEEKIFSLLDKFKYIIPQGSPMSGIGNPYQLQSLSNCFVIQGVYSDKLDSYGGIMLADQELAQIMKRRGGCGLDISGIRPKNALTNNAAKTTDGIAVFMERFSNTCREVAQNGRRGAEMITISINHPEIETFINIKRDLKKVTGANISIKMNDEFMNAVKSDQEYTLRWPVDLSVENAKITKVVRAKDIWDQVIDSAWTSAEPGILFWDNVQKNTPADLYEEYKSISTNPCGEIVLSAYDACRLLVLNLTSYVKNPFTRDACFDFDLFHTHTIIAQRLMDDIIDLEIEFIDKILAKVNSDPEPQEAKLVEINLWNKIRKANEQGRRTGLGITGLGDALAMLGIKYGSDESISKTYEIYRALAVGAHTSSCIMAEERGAFSCFDYEKEKDHEYLNSIMDDAAVWVKQSWKRYGRRNIALTTTAPTGSVSTLTQTTSGIEPAYSLSYIRRKKINPSDKAARVDFIDDMGDKWQEFTIYHHGLKKWIEVTGNENIEESPYWGATATEIDWVASVDLQAAAQKSIDHSISKTCNLPKDVSKDVVSEVYMRAWTAGCKGFTVYRDGCRTGILVSDKQKNDKDEDGRPVDIIYMPAPKRPLELPCDIKKSKIQGEGWTIFVGLLNGKPYEVFGGLSKYIDIPNKYREGKIVKNGKNSDGITAYNLVVGEGDDQMIIRDIANVFENKNYGALTRTISLAIRHGAPIQFIVEQLSKDKFSDMTSFSKVISRVLKKYIKDGTSSGEKVCSSCNSSGTLVYYEGCVMCTSCGVSKCG